MTDKTTDMRYITKVQLIDFQDHKNTEINLDPGINLIIGSSDAGKSAILRAINFVFHNQPSGDYFIRKGCSEACVSIWFNDNHIVTRIKGASRNAIIVHKPNGEQLVYEKIGREIPPEALLALGNPPIDEKHGPLSYAEQLSSYFLVSLSPTELPRSISELTGINDFEDAAQLLSKRGKAMERQAKECQTRIDAYEESLEKFNGLDDKLCNLEKLEKKSESVDYIEKIILQISRILEEYENVISNVDKATERLKKAESVALLEINLTPLHKAQSAISVMENLCNNHKSNINQGEKSRTVIKRLNNILSDIMISKLDKAKQIQILIQEIESLLRKYSDVMKKGNLIKSEYDTFVLQYKKLTKEQQGIVAEMKSKGLWCDICNRPAMNNHESGGVCG